MGRRIVLMKFMKPEDEEVEVPEVAIVAVSSMVVVGGLVGALLEMRPVGSERGRAITLALFWRDLKLRCEKQGGRGVCKIGYLGRSLAEACIGTTLGDAFDSVLHAPSRSDEMS